MAVLNINGVDNALVNPPLPDDFYTCPYAQRDLQQL